MTSHLLQECNTLRRAAGLDRRAALKLFVSGATLALASCGRPNEQVVPYVQIPEREIPGVPLRFATTLSLGGYGRGVVVTSVEGRPIKINGNPRHPASLGSTDIYAEAEVLSLYDPTAPGHHMAAAASNRGALSRRHYNRSWRRSHSARVGD